MSDPTSGPAPLPAPLPPTFAATRAALHRLAVYVVAPARRQATGRIGLRWTEGGFGTPPFGEDAAQVRVERATLVVSARGTEARHPLTSLAAAAGAAGVDLVDDPGVGSDIPPLGDAGAPLDVDPHAAAALGAWYGFATSVLEELREQRHEAGAAPSALQLWPEHFDLAFDAAEVNYGCSPGDSFSEEPYLYVGPWNRDSLSDPFWNAPFGAVLAYQDLLGVPDARAAASAFLRAGVAQATAR